MKAEYSSKLEAAYALQAVTVDEAKADKDKLRTEIAKSTEQKEAGCRAEVAAAHAETVAARQAANVAKDMQEMAEEKVREIKRWVQKEHSELGRHVQRLNDQLAAKNDENVRLRELLAIHDKRLKEEERVKMETIQERDRIVAEIKRRQEKVDVLTGQSTNLEDENARIMALLEKEIGKVEELNLALKETQVKLAETEQVTAEKYHNMFLQNEWAKFSDAYDALLQRVLRAAAAILREGVRSPWGMLTAPQEKLVAYSSFHRRLSRGLGLSPKETPCMHGSRPKRSSSTTRSHGSVRCVSSSSILLASGPASGPGGA